MYIKNQFSFNTLRAVLFNSCNHIGIRTPDDDRIPLENIFCRKKGIGQKKGSKSRKEKDEFVQMYKIVLFTGENLPEIY